jgi:transmembrane sensor
MDNHQKYELLVQRYLDNTATQEELELFFHLLREGKLDDHLDKISSAPQHATPVFPLKSAPAAGRPTYSLVRYSVAASLILFISAGIYLVLRKTGTTPSQDATAKNITTPVAVPGTKKATLLLSDGRTIALDKADQTIRDGNTEIVAKDNSLVYQANAQAGNSYNTITTPKGGEYQLTLPDGSVVWLNAESSLRYPVAFTGAERIVELKGEAYFEVAKNAAQPFIVQSKQAAVKVLGTHFNVMAYDDENYMKTSLEEGSVLVMKNGQQQVLKPGEGATIADGGNSIAVASADLTHDLAWKNGQFYFNKTELTTIMKQIARWYDLEIRYSGTVPQQRFVGRISRNTNLSDVLDLLRLSEVKFSMTGKTLIVEQ